MHEFLEQQMHVLDEMTEFRIPPYKSLKQWTMVHKQRWSQTFLSNYSAYFAYSPRGGGGWLLFRECRCWFANCLGSFSRPSTLGRVDPNVFCLQTVRWLSKISSASASVGRSGGGRWSDGRRSWLGEDIRIQKLFGYVQEHIQKRPPDPVIKWWKNPIKVGVKQPRANNPLIFGHLYGRTPCPPYL